MTDHLDEAAAKAVDLAEDLLGPRSDLTTYMAAAHLAYMAGLLRGSSTYLPDRSGQRRGTPPDEPLRFYPSTGSYDKVQVAPRTALDSDVEQERDRFRAQRDELLAAARKALAEQTPTAELDLDEVVTRIEQER